VKLPKRKHADRRYLSPAQVAALAAAVKRDPEVVRFLAYTGLRWGEMAALRVCDFDMLRRRVNVSRSVTESGGLVWSTPKTWERRSVPFPSVIADELAALMVGKDRDALVFTDMRGGVLRSSYWRARVFQPAVQKCQTDDDTFPAIMPHDLRHTVASLAVSAGANVKAVQRMLGHAKASMTLDVYADLFDDDLDGVADRLDAAIKILPTPAIRPPADSPPNSKLRWGGQPWSRSPDVGASAQSSAKSATSSQPSSPQV
jgi:integrase